MLAPHGGQKWLSPISTLDRKIIVTVLIEDEAASPFESGYRPHRFEFDIPLVSDARSGKHEFDVDLYWVPEKGVYSEAAHPIPEVKLTFPHQEVF